MDQNLDRLLGWVSTNLAGVAPEIHLYYYSVKSSYVLLMWKSSWEISPV